MPSTKELIHKHTLFNMYKYGNADLGSILGKLISEDPKLKKDIKKVMELIKKEITVIATLAKTKIEHEIKKKYPDLLEKKKEEERALPELKNVKKNVVMRYAPYPSGPLHIGNARQAILNDEYVKKYKGKLLLVMDDTIGSAEKNITSEAYDLIQESLDWLGVRYDKIIYKSDRLEIYYAYALKLIEKEKAYVCTCSSEILRENRVAEKECDCRNVSVEKTLALWKHMFDAEEGSMTLRIKTSLRHKNPAFRDRVLFRISHRLHPRVQHQYTVWPLLDMSWAVDDYLLGVTHVLRGKDLMMESEMERYIWDILGLPDREIIHTGLFHIEGAKISKSKSKQEVLSGEYRGWDDPRTWSLQSLQRRGIYPETIRTFCLSFGLNQTEIAVPVDALYSENKKIVELKANRYFFVEDPKKITINKAPKKIAKLPLHPDDKKRGMRTLKTGTDFYIQDELIKHKHYRFMHLFNFKDGVFVSNNVDATLQATLIHWLPVSNDLIDVEILMPDGGTKKGLGEATLSMVKKGDVIQFERFGFCRCDSKTKTKMIFWFSHT